MRASASKNRVKIITFMIKITRETTHYQKDQMLNENYKEMFANTH